MDYGTIVLSLLSALIGTALGAGIILYAQGLKNNNTRKLAGSALKFIKEYAKKKNTYVAARDGFNNRFNLAEKRAIIVALHKIGIPIDIPTSGLFSIQQISFLDEEIVEKEIDDMIAQIKSGNCDHFFFADVDLYINENVRMKAIRNIAKKYVEKVMKKSQAHVTENKIQTPMGLKEFTVGEQSIIGVFRLRTNDLSYYQVDGTPNIAEMDKLISEIEIGLWDYVLQWDYESYFNMSTQRRSAEVLCNFEGLLPMLSTLFPSNSTSGNIQLKQEEK